VTARDAELEARFWQLAAALLTRKITQQEFVGDALIAAGDYAVRHAIDVGDTPDTTVRRRRALADANPVRKPKARTP